MTSIRQYVKKFSALFSGNTEFHGVHVPEKNPKEGTKAKGKSFTRREPLEPKHFIKHLMGQESIGVVPLDADGNVNFSVLDVDEYPLIPARILNTLTRAKLPLMGFRSKSGGLHLYCFFRKPSPATSVLPLMRQIRQILGLKRDTELFPKQTKLIGDGTGNWINLPYFAGLETVRYAYDSKSGALHLGDAVAQAWAARTTITELKGIIESIPLTQAPPCLQTLYMLGGAEEGARNAFLFNCASYLKARFAEGFAENLHLLNRQLDKPLPYEELDRTIIASHNKGDYHYQCTDGVLMLHCDKEVCGERKYGKGVGHVSDLSFGQLTQIVCTQPYYQWVISDKQMTFHSEADLINQNKFRELCLRHLHKVPARLTDIAWAKILNRALTNVKELELNAAEDMSEDSLWLSKVTSFFSVKKAVRPSQVEDGLVFNNGLNILHFKPAKLMEYLEKTGMFRHFKPSQHRALLKKLGAQEGKLRYPEYNKTARTWHIDLNTAHAKEFLTEVELYSNNSEEELDAKTPLDYIGEEKY